MARGSSKYRGFRRSARDARDYAHKVDDTRVPYAGCHCWTCKDRRDDLHGERLGDLLGTDEPSFEPEPKGGTK